MADTNKVALVIGVDIYHHKRDDGIPSLIPLPSSKKDAINLYEILRLEEYGYEIFQDGPIVGSNFPEGQAHKILEMTKKFFEEAEPAQTALFYFSGHGIYHGGEVYLALPETDPASPLFNSLNVSDLTRLINNSRSTRIVGIIDACHSGAANISLSQTGMIDKNLAENEAAAAVAVYDKIGANIPIAEGRCLLLSSQMYQKSQADSTNNSIYTKYLISGLKGVKSSKDENGKTVPGSVNEYGFVTPSTLHEYVYNMVANEIRSQTPRIKSSYSSTIALALHPNLAIRGSMEVLLELLKEGNVAGFNKLAEPYQTVGAIEHGYLIRERRTLEKPFEHRLDFGGQMIDNVNLTGVDLHQADICRTIIVDSDLSGAILKEANLASARLDRTNLRGAFLEHAYLSQANLSYTDLSEAKLSRALLLAVELCHANLSKANFYNSVIVNCHSYDELKCDDADFESAILDQEELVEHLKKYGAKNVPRAITSKNELELELKKRGYKGKEVEKALQHSVFR